MESFKKLHDFIYANIKGIIASDMDYHIPLQNDPKYLGLVPNPVNIKKLQPLPLNLNDEINIFHGINTESYFKKGSDYFEAALKVITEKYGNRVNITTSRSIPYNDYIQLYDKAHILLDQTYGHDQGYNALEAMAKGKVVFTGAEKEFEEFYNLKQKVNINAKPDLEYLIASLSFLIENPHEIAAIGQRARIFIEKEHDYILSAKKYLNTWNK